MSTSPSVGAAAISPASARERPRSSRSAGMRNGTPCTVTADADWADVPAASIATRRRAPTSSAGTVLVTPASNVTAAAVPGRVSPCDL